MRIYWIKYILRQNLTEYRNRGEIFDSGKEFQPEIAYTN
jgi:hypothetical protein